MAWAPSGVIFWALGLAEPATPASCGMDLSRQSAAVSSGEQHDQRSGADRRTGPSGGLRAVLPKPAARCRSGRACDHSGREDPRPSPARLRPGRPEWPSSDLADIAFRRLEAHRHPFAFRSPEVSRRRHMISGALLAAYPGSNSRPASRGLRDVLLTQGGSVKADAEAGIDAWRTPLFSCRRDHGMIPFDL